MSTFKERILIYRLGSLGDTIMALPCFHKVRQSFPDADITLLTNHPVMSKAASIESILGSDYFFDRLLTYPLGSRNIKFLAKLIKQIRTLKIDTVINLTAARSKMSVKRDYWFFKVAGVRKFIGFPSTIEDFEVCIDPLTGYKEWEAKRLCRRISLLGLTDLNDESSWDLRLTNAELQTADLLLSDIYNSNSLIALSVGTNRQATDWGFNNWASLLHRLSSALKNWRLVIIGATEDAKLAEELMLVWGHNSLNLCGKTTPRVSAAVLKKAKIFLGHDSGPMHLATCVGTPCVAVFSARNLPGQWFPRGTANEILYHQTDCAGCGLEVCIVQQKKCILSITIDEVERSVLKIINKSIISSSFNK